MKYFKDYLLKFQKNLLVTLETLDFLIILLITNFQFRLLLHVVHLVMIESPFQYLLDQMLLFPFKMGIIPFLVSNHY